MNKYETDYITKTCKKNKNRATWIIKENTHEPIIEKEKYDEVQKIKLGKKGTKRVKHEYLLKDLLYCGECRRKMQYKVYRSKDRQKFLNESSRFNCSLLYKKKCTNKTYIKEKELNYIVKNELEKKLSLINTNKLVNKLIAKIKESDENIQKIKEYKNEIEKLERKKSVLYKKKCDKYISAQEFKNEYAKVKEEIKKIENLIKKIENNNDNNKLEKEKIEKIIAEVKKGSCINNTFLKEIINRIEVYSKNRIVITFNI